MRGSTLGRVIFSSFLLLVVVSSFPAKTFATDLGETISIGPAIVTQFIQPGSTANGSATITNRSNIPYFYISYVTPYYVHDENYDPSFVNLPGKPNISKWFHISSSTSGLLLPGAAAVINYTISVPPNTPPGGYYAALFAQTTAATQSVQNRNLSINERVGSIFYIQATGPVNQQGNVATWHTNFLQKPPVTSLLRLNNNGNTFYVANINVTYRDILGNAKYSFSSNKIVLQDTIRRTVITWPHSPSFGLFKVNGSVSIYGNVQLKTAYILVISQAYRIAFIVFLAVIALLIILSIMGRANRQSKISESKTQK